MNDDEPLIDTNVLVHAYVLSNEKRHAMATCRGRRGLRGGVDCFLFGLALWWNYTT